MNPAILPPPSPPNTLWRRWSGPMTDELSRDTGPFGLPQLPRRLAPDRVLSAVCGFCSTGCNLKLHLRDEQPVNLTPDPDYPVNLGMACPKGWESLTPLGAPDRATTPLLRGPGGTLQPTDWPTALREFRSRFQEIQQRHGPDSVAWLGTGQIPTEELAFLGALAKFGMGFRHGDGNTRQCMATAATAYKQAFGFDAPPFTYADFEQSDVLVLVGSNLCIAHPILWQRVLRNRRSPEIIVIDPRRTETAAAATQHLALKPKSDLTLLYGLAHLLIQMDAVHHSFVRQHTTGFDEFREFVRAFTPDRVAAETGLTAGSLVRAARTIAGAAATSFWWTMGVNQGHQATRTAQAIINLALLTGNIGRPGTGANSITGQCNAMGSRIFSNTTSLLGGHDFQNPDHRAKVSRILEIPPENIPSEPSCAYPEILSGILSGKIKGLWIVATNPAHSWINQDQFKEIVDRLDFLVVQDMYSSTETAQIADLVLPAAAWGEKEGTFINSERRIGTIKKVRKAPGQALADFSIFKLVAEAWGCGPMFQKWSSPEATFGLLRDLTADRPCDITGIESYEHLDQLGGIQWPYPASNPSSGNQRRLFSDGKFYHADSKARFLYEAPRPLPEQTSETYPLLFLTGRGTVAQWHTETRTRQSPVLRKLSANGPLFEINPADARKLKIHSQDLVAIESQRGVIQARAFVTPTVSAGQIFMAMHDASTNRLTDAVFDPYSRQPSYKSCAVRLRKI